jgi:ABC-type transport system involved in cytochrome c biogenesis ATPase subunit
MMTAVIEVTGLTKRYGGQAVVDDIAFHVDAGEIFGILGPNGAGKTTAVECMEGLRRRDGGEVRILGLDPLTDRHRLHQRIGVQLQESQLQEKLKVREALELYASFYPNPADWRELLERWGLAGKADTKFAKLSGGQKQRLFIALALIGKPGGGVPRRADLRAGPGCAARHLGPDQPGAGAGRHRRAGQPLHGRGGGTVRPRRDPRTGADRGAGHPGGSCRPRRGEYRVRFRRWPSRVNQSSTSSR